MPLKYCPHCGGKLPAEGNGQRKEPARKRERKEPASMEERGIIPALMDGFRILKGKD